LPVNRKSKKPLSRLASRQQKKPWSGLTFGGQMFKTLCQSDKSAAKVRNALPDSPVGSKKRPFARLASRRQN